MGLGGRWKTLLGCGGGGGGRRKLFAAVDSYVGYVFEAVYVKSF
jgi:hypothetical protein